METRESESGLRSAELAAPSHLFLVGIWKPDCEKVQFVGKNQKNECIINSFWHLNIRRVCVCVCIQYCYFANSCSNLALFRLALVKATYSEHYSPCLSSWKCNKLRFCFQNRVGARKLNEFALRAQPWDPALRPTRAGIIQGWEFSLTWSV